ncbi:MAG: type II toxin-antitoxin system mRNA interferase toxin, RelE/StbE family [bacterium]|nr:type II toxin-antitoxin system mRNA interferase toxin, RelE/StbE family [bacterium]
MKEIELDSGVVKSIKKVRSSNLPLYKKIKKQLSLFQQNPQHPSLRTHKLTGDLKDSWSISIDRNHRMLYYDGVTFRFFLFGTHDEVYKK